MPATALPNRSRIAQQPLQERAMPATALPKRSRIA